MVRNERIAGSDAERIINPPPRTKFGSVSYLFPKTPKLCCPCRLTYRQHSEGESNMKRLGSLYLTTMLFVKNQGEVTSVLNVLQVVLNNKHA